MDAVPERDVGDVGAGDVQPLRFGGSGPDPGRRRSGPASTISPAGIVTPPTVNRCGGHVGQRHLDGSVVAQQLLDRGRQQVRPGPQQRELVRGG